MAIDLRDLERLIADKDFKGVRAELSVLQDADIALFMEELQREHVVMVFRSLPKDRAAEIFSLFIQRHAAVYCRSDHGPRSKLHH